MPCREFLDFGNELFASHLVEVCVRYLLLPSFCLLAEATRGLATAGSTPEPVIEPTRDEANKATPVFWPGPLVVPRPPGEA